MYSLRLIWEEVEASKKILRLKNMLSMLIKHLNLSVVISFMLIKKECICL